MSEGQFKLLGRKPPASGRDRQARSNRSGRHTHDDKLEFILLPYQNHGQSGLPEVPNLGKPLYVSKPLVSEFDSGEGTAYGWE